jgi:hypothetical protein
MQCSLRESSATLLNGSHGYSRGRPVARALSSVTRRQSLHRPGRRTREKCRRDRRQLHRVGSRGVLACTECACGCGRARPDTDGAGREIGAMIRKLHEDHGVQFHLPGKVRSLSDHQVVLESNETLALRQATSHVGPIRTQGRRFASSTGLSPSDRARPRRVT